ncbi:MAG: rhomboid family intramembrane serine protease [Clostridia bacterium]|nr:rhomboid family intramembrane serine protease [Clostridia bacterium]
MTGHLPRRSRPVVTWTLAAATVATWTYVATHGGTTDIAALVRYGAEVRELVWAGEWWRLVTPLFLHFGWLHLVVNVWALAILGREAEAVFGPLRLLALYFGSGLGGSLAELLLDRRPAVTVGASGALFGLLGALLYAATLVPGELRWRGVRAVLVPILANLAYGFLLSRTVNNYAHVGGLAAGVALALALGAPGERGRGSLRLLGAAAVLALVAFAAWGWQAARPAA